MTELVPMDYVTVYQACRAFYNLSTTEVSIIDLLANNGTFIGDPRDLSKKLKICYTQITAALNSLDNIGVVLRNTTGDKKVRMRAVSLCPHWEYNLVKAYESGDQISLKNKRQFPSQCNSI
ncbi:unknown [Clostridium sp. CAG:678]|nr:unknown [Clostridium sp. CAG:678]